MKRITVENNVNVSLQIGKEVFVAEQNITLKDELAEHVYKKTGYQNSPHLFKEDDIPHIVVIKERALKQR